MMSSQRLHVGDLPFSATREDILAAFEAAFGGPQRILGAVTEPRAVGQLLVALGLAAQPPPGCPVSAA